MYREHARSLYRYVVCFKDRYVGEYRHVAAGTIVTIRRDGATLLMNVRDSGRPEMSFVARTETRFASSIFTLEFHLDGQGR